MYWHWKVKVVIIQEILEPLKLRYHCGMHMSADWLMKNRRMERCKKLREITLRRSDVYIEESCGDMDFRFYGGYGGVLV